MITTTNTIEALATTACAVATFLVIFYMFQPSPVCDFDCRWSAVFFQ